MLKFTLAIKDLSSNSVASFDVVVAQSPLHAIRKAAQFLGLREYKVVRCGYCNWEQIRSSQVDLA